MKQASSVIPADLRSKSLTANRQPFKSVEESSDLETSEVPTESGTSSPVRKNALDHLNLAESLDDTKSHLLEGSESEQGGRSITLCVKIPSKRPF